MCSLVLGDSPNVCFMEGFCSEAIVRTLLWLMLTVQLPRAVGNMETFWNSRSRYIWNAHSRPLTPWAFPLRLKDQTALWAI